MYRKYLNMKISYSELTSLIKELINDIEQNCDIYRCFAFPKTIRSVLIASQYSDIAHHFRDKKYYGIFKNTIYLSHVIRILNRMCDEKYIYFVDVNNKRLYKTLNDYTHDDMEINLTEKELKEIESLLNIEDL